MLLVLCILFFCGCSLSAQRSAHLPGGVPAISFKLAVMALSITVKVLKWLPFAPSLASVVKASSARLW